VAHTHEPESNPHVRASLLEAKLSDILELSLDCLLTLLGSMVRRTVMLHASSTRYQKSLFCMAPYIIFSLPPVTPVFIYSHALSLDTRKQCD